MFNQWCDVFIEAYISCTHDDDDDDDVKEQIKP